MVSSSRKTTSASDSRIDAAMASVSRLNTSVLKVMTVSDGPSRVPSGLGKNKAPQRYTQTVTASRPPSNSDLRRLNQATTKTSGTGTNKYTATALTTNSHQVASRTNQ